MINIANTFTNRKLFLNTYFNVSTNYGHSLLKINDNISWKLIFKYDSLSDVTF